MLQPLLRDYFIDLSEARIIDPFAQTGLVFPLLSQFNPANIDLFDPDDSQPLPKKSLPPFDPTQPWPAHLTYDWLISYPPMYPTTYLPQGTLTPKLLIEAAWSNVSNFAIVVKLNFLEPTQVRQSVLELIQPHLTNVYIYGSPRPSNRESVTSCLIVIQRHLNWGENSPIKFTTNWK